MTTAVQNCLKIVFVDKYFLASRVTGYEHVSGDTAVPGAIHLSSRGADNYQASSQQFLCRYLIFGWWLPLPVYWVLLTSGTLTK